MTFVTAAIGVGARMTAELRSDQARSELQDSTNAYLAQSLEGIDQIQ